MFKHIKKYNLFESSKIDDENLLIVKDCFQDIVDEFDLEWVDSIDWFHLVNGSYNIRKIEGNSDWSILIDIILPTKMRCKENINNNFFLRVGVLNTARKDIYDPKNIELYEVYLDMINSCIERMYKMGFEDLRFLKDSVHHQIAIKI